jgi:hypothetical protein
MKRPNKYTYLFIVQGYYINQWEDVDQSESQREARASLKAYRTNDPKHAYRMIYRRELN